jgi:4,5-DOPA dioxygenase extradiol
MKGDAMDGPGRMPSLFVGHGSPMNAVEDNELTRAWAAAARGMPRPRAVLCISAHWETGGVLLTASENPETIHDFYGFPAKLHAVRYPAPGDPGLAARAAELLRHAEAGLDGRRGLDHGSWSVLRAMYPRADVPVVQLSLDSTRSPRGHYELARELAPLRDEGVLILGSGNIVHNLRYADFGREDGYDWAVRFDQEVRSRIRAGDHGALAAYQGLGADATLAVPTPEHYLPLLYVLAVQAQGEEAAFFNERTLLGSVSMTCVRMGQ